VSSKADHSTESDVNLLAHDEYYDVHAISGLLKLYLRELPASILTSERRDDFVKITEIEDKNEKITALNKLVHSLPEANFALLKALSGHLLRIVDNSDVNKMTIRNVGIVFSPTLNIPAQVFSMFLHEYRYIFFRDADGNPPAFAPPTAAPPQPPRSPMPPMMSPRTQNFDFPERRMMEPPRTPMLPSHPAAIRPPGMAQQTVAYEPNYENQPQISSPTQISSPRFDIPPPSNDSSSGNSLAVPGADAKSNKSRRRESSMMFMMGGLKKSPFQKSPNGEPDPSSSLER
jgi:RalA-binding protein 1